MKPDDFRTPQFKEACRIIHVCRDVFGKPWTCTRQDVEAVACFVYGSQEPETLGLWAGAASLIMYIHDGGR